MCQEEKKLDHMIITEISWFFTNIKKIRSTILIIALMLYFFSDIVDIVDGIFS